MLLSESIKTHRQRLRLSQEYVAEQVGVSRQAVSKWETGQSVPTSGNLAELAALFDISISELIEPEKYQTVKQAERNNAVKSYQNKRMLTSCLYGHIAAAVAYPALLRENGVSVLSVFLCIALLTGLVFMGIAALDYGRKARFKPLQILLGAAFAFACFVLPFCLSRMSEQIRSLICILSCAACIVPLYILYWKKVWHYQSIDGRQHVL